MDLASPATSLVLFWTITRAVALAVLSTEAFFLLVRMRSNGDEPAPASRLVWAVTPAALLAGLALWCSSALPGPGAARPSAALAHHDTLSTSSR